MDLDEPDIPNGQGFRESRNPRQPQQATLMDWWPQDFRDQEVSFENGYVQNNHNRGYQNQFQGQTRQWQNSRQSQAKAFRYRNATQNRSGGYNYGPFRFDYRQNGAGGRSNGPYRNYQDRYSRERFGGQNQAPFRPQRRQQQQRS
ncbi:unnamed protein product, partial [Didymodactylos carnosus]